VTLRLVAIASHLLGLALLLGYLHLVGVGPFSNARARHLRDMKERAALPAACEPVSFEDMAALPHAKPLAAYAPIERRAVTLEAYCQRMLYASDGDYHLELVPVPPEPLGSDAPYVTAEVTLPLRRNRPAWGYETLAAELRPAHRDGLAWERRPQRVRVSGWLLYDYQYDGASMSPEYLRYLWHKYGIGMNTERGKPVQVWRRITGWEIHPVTRLEVWDDARGAWRGLGAAAGGAGS
jgi:hypothetical protein